MLDIYRSFADQLEAAHARTGRPMKFGEVRIVVPSQTYMELGYELEKLHRGFPSSGNPRLGYFPQAMSCIVINEFLIIEPEQK